MDKYSKLDLEIKKFIENEDDVKVPREISKGIDDALNYIKTRNKNKKMKKRFMVASTIALLILTVPFIVTAYINKNYKYIPGSGVVSSEDGLNYVLESPISQNVDEVMDITLRKININEYKNQITVKVEGEYYEPKNVSEIKIGNKKKALIGNVVESSSGDGRLDKWIYEAKFNYYRKYKNENIKFIMNWDSGKSVEFNSKLIESESESDIKKLGTTDNKCNIPITMISQEKGNILDVNFINNADLKNELTFYGQQISKKEVNSDYARKQMDVVKLTDDNGDFMIGEFVEHLDRNNHFRFDITDMKKPYTITIPEITMFARFENVRSEELELKIDDYNVETTFNKELELNTSDGLYKNTNNKIKLIKGIKDYENNYTIYVKMINEDKNPMKIQSVYVRPSGESIKVVEEDFFEGGVSGAIESDNSYSYTFKLPYPDSDKLYIKFEVSDYKIEGKWSFKLE